MQSEDGGEQRTSHEGTGKTFGPQIHLSQNISENSFSAPLVDGHPET
jgi:hypothetical protein